jgi:mTERF domain-containing protein
MDLSDEDIRVMLGRHPTILHMSADKNLAPKILFLVRALDLSKEELRAIIVQYPSVLCYSKLNLKFKVNFFLKLMAYTAEECRALFVSEPKLLTAGVKTGLIPHMRFFLKDMEIPLDKFR